MHIKLDTAKVEFNYQKAYIESELVTSLRYKHLSVYKLLLKNIMNWACYYMFDEEIALLMLKGGLFLSKVTDQ